MVGVLISLSMQFENHFLQKYTSQWLSMGLVDPNLVTDDVSQPGWAIREYSAMF